MPDKATLKSSRQEVEAGDHRLARETASLGLTPIEPVAPASIPCICQLLGQLWGNAVVCNKPGHPLPKFTVEVIN